MEIDAAQIKTQINLPQSSNQNIHPYTSIYITQNTDPNKTKICKRNPLKQTQIFSYQSLLVFRNQGILILRDKQQQTTKYAQRLRTLNSLRQQKQNKTLLVKIKKDPQNNMHHPQNIIKIIIHKLRTISGQFVPTSFQQNERFVSNKGKKLRVIIANFTTFLSRFGVVIVNLEEKYNCMQPAINNYC
eukprot:TRINITY_DN6175_c0_g1_i3.p2 TRINITY_DN6175_c0_g1~~TRINITY_DN6175_c0_g1_i3.p2  ORF type:complete len:187 (+),score=1.10 TRINITY_DN6175_c0_g1_i3:692-1252(+)